MAKGKSGGMNAALKKVGRGMAKANNQASSAKVPMKFASGGGVKMPDAKSMGSLGGSGMERGGFGKGTARGTGAATKGKSFGGEY